jgi:predicted transposase YdaD
LTAEICKTFEELGWTEKWIESGRKEGRTEDEQAKALAIARNLLKKNMAVADIVDATSLSHDKIDEIKKLAH